MTALLIVGAGPTGLTAAVELARRGIAARVIDAKSDPLPLSRAVGINAHSLTLLQASGVAERLLNAGIRVRELLIHDHERVISRIRLDREEQPYNFMLALPQDETEAILTRRFKALGGRVEFGVELSGLAIAGDQAQATLTNTADGRVEEAAYDRVLGADGVHSAVREAAGLPFEGFDLPGTWGVADLESAAWPHRDRACLFRRPEGAILVVIPIGPFRYRVVANHPKALDALPTGLTVDRLRREAEFEIAIRQVPAYAAGPVFLAGDAAHCHSPAGGRGMNLGMADAASFARRFAEEEPGETLAGYSAERHAHGQETIKLSENLRRTMTREDPLARWLVGAGLRLVGHTPTLQKRLARQMLDIR